MFQPPLFREERMDIMHMLMTDHPFATLVSVATGDLSADHVPLVLHAGLAPKGILRGHLAKGNPLCGAAGAAMPVLAVFQGPQAYVSPSWYASKAEHGKVVPTWNYAVVHAHGTLRFRTDPDWLMEHLAELTSRNERHRAAPWAVTDAPPAYIARQLKGLVGIEIEVERLSGTWKLSQNKNERDRTGVERGLLGEGSQQAGDVSRLVERAAR